MGTVSPAVQLFIEHLRTGKSLFASAQLNLKLETLLHLRWEKVLGRELAVVGVLLMDVLKKRFQGRSGATMAQRLLCSTSASVEGFGCRPIAVMRLAPWPASESLQ
jgi:hypothetical protein